MKNLLFSFIILLNLIASSLAGTLSVYEKDDRQNVSNLSGIYQELSKSVAIIAKNNSQLLTPVDKFGMCRKERFSKEISIGECTAFLVSPTKLVTAGHCIKDEKTFCKEHKLVFNYLDSTTFFSNAFSYRQNILNCKSAKINPLFDIATIELKLATNAPDLSSKLSYSTKLPKSVFVIGSPLGLPLKMTSSSTVEAYTNDEIRVETDTFTGNSGSPVFDYASNKVIGVLVAGEIDFTYSKTNSCMEVKRCAEFKCSGESVIKLSSLKNLF